MVSSLERGVLSFSQGICNPLSETVQQRRCPGTMLYKGPKVREGIIGSVSLALSSRPDSRAEELRATGAMSGFAAGAIERHTYHCR